MQIRTQTSELFTWFERPVEIVALCARMLLAAGLLIALFLKLYMLILTDYRCEAELDSLGNTIRCSGALEMISGTLILVAGLGFGAALFSRAGLDLIETLSMALCAVVINFLANISYDTATWQTAAVILSLFAAFVGLTLIGRSLNPGRLARGPTARTPSPPDPPSGQ